VPPDGAVGVHAPGHVYVAVYEKVVGDGVVHTQYVATAEGAVVVKPMAPLNLIA
jgi:hypothetical protein